MDYGSGFIQSSLEINPELIEDLQGILNLFQNFDIFGWKDQIIRACSNNWVINGSLSYSGKPILCNDPHFQLILPSVLWQFHFVNTSENFDNRQTWYKNTQE